MARPVGLPGPVIFLASLMLSYGCAGPQSEPTPSSNSDPSKVAPSADSYRILFGSCLDEERSTAILDRVVSAEPDLFIFLGDNVYADTSDPEIFRAKYQKLGSQPDYQRLQSTCPVLATWDDHDYGKNDAGVEFEQKEISKEIMLDFFGEPRGSARRSRPGIYDSRLFDWGDFRVNVILLDTRYFRSPLRRRAQRPEGRGPYSPDPRPGLSMLGSDQWRWLEAQLRHPADLRIIATSIQFAADEHGYECWGNLPTERERFYKLIRETEADGVVFISGDRHHAEISRIDPRESQVGYPLYDVTSSSLNRARGEHDEPNRHRVGAVVGDDNFGGIEIGGAGSERWLEFKIWSASGVVKAEHRLSLEELRSK